MAYYLIIRGPLGSGKTTISRRLTQELGARYVVIDRILDEHNLTNDHEDGYISQHSFKQVNEIVAPEAMRTLESGTPVIFDGNFYWKSQINDLISRLGFPHEVFSLNVPLEVCVERDSHRDKTHGKGAAEAVYKKSTSFSCGIPIDGTGTVDVTIAAIRSRLP